GIIVPDALLCGDLPGRVHRGERGPQVIDAGEDRQRLLGGAWGGVRQRIAPGAGAGEGGESGAEDLREDDAGRGARLDLGEGRRDGGQDVRRGRGIAWVA